jgi:hypothetical protein
MMPDMVTVALSDIAGPYLPIFDDSGCFRVSSA